MNSKNFNNQSNSASFFSPMTTNGVSESSFSYMKFINFFTKQNPINYEAIKNFQKLLEEKNEALVPMDYLDDNFISLSTFKEELNEISSAFNSCADDSHQ